MNGRLVVRGGHQDGFVRRDLHAQHRWSVEVGEEDQHVVLILVAFDVLEQRRAPGPLLFEPLDFLVARVRVVEDPLGVAVERVNVPGARVGKTTHRDAAHAIRALRVVVLPGDVVLRAGGQHFDVMPGCEPFGNQPAVILGTAENLGAVTLHDKRNLQRRLIAQGSGFKAGQPATMSESRFSIRAGAKSASLPPLSLDHPIANWSIVHEHAEHFGGEFEIFGFEQHTGAAERLRNGPRGIGQDRNIGGHRLYQRNTKSLMLAERDIYVRPPVKRRQVFVGHRTGEPEPIRQHAKL